MKVMSMVPGFGERLARLCRFTAVAALAAFFWPDVSRAEPTHVDVRVLGKDATFVGSGTGGVKVTLSDARNGTVLAEGVTNGTSGDARKILGAPSKRNGILHTDDSAFFRATLDIEEPTLVQLRVFGPLEREGSEMEVTSTHWLLPGKHLTAGNGWLVELPGFLIEPLSPTPGKAADGYAPTDGMIRVHVTPMCGCAIKPEGYWPPERYDVAVALTRDGKPAGTVDLKYAGQPSVFSGSARFEKAGFYEATITVFDPENGNAGVKKFGFSVNDEN